MSEMYEPADGAVPMHHDDLAAIPSVGRLVGPGFAEVPQHFVDALRSHGWRVGPRHDPEPHADPRDAEIERLNKILVTRDRNVAAAERNLAAITAELEAANTRIQDAEAEARAGRQEADTAKALALSLRSDLASALQAAGAEDKALVAANAKIKKLQDNAANREREIAALTAEVDAKEKQITKLLNQAEAAKKRS